MTIIDGDKPDGNDEEWVPQDDDEDFGLEIIDEEENPEENPPEEDEEDQETVAVNARQDRIQKRIDQLTAQKHDEARRADAAEAQLKAMDERMARLESGVSTQSEDAFRSKYEDVKSKLFQAAEEGDTATQVELTEQLADMRAETRFREAAARVQKETEPREAEQPQQGQAPQAAKDWWSRNTWFASDEKQAESAYARQVDIQLEREGYDKTSTGYYEELDNRLQSRFPELYSKSGSKKKPPAKAPTTPSGSKGRSKNSKGRVRLTREQLAVAKELNLTTPEELKAYAKEIQESL